MYKKSIDAITGQESENIIKRKSDNASIPKDPNNKDYQEILKWVDAGNTIEEAD